MVIEVELVPSIDEARLNRDEAIVFLFQTRRIKIEAVTEQGVYWAMQTLRQLEQKKGKRSSVAGCEIVDWAGIQDTRIYAGCGTQLYFNGRIEKRDRDFIPV